jgi:hypothetical protein
MYNKQQRKAAAFFISQMSEHMHDSRAPPLAIGMVWNEAWDRRDEIKGKTAHCGGKCRTMVAPEAMLGHCSHIPTDTMLVTETLT